MADIEITQQTLIRLAPNAAPWIVQGIIAHQKLLAFAKIDTPLRWCHFISQTTFESAGLRTTLEYASGNAYEGRLDLGNNQPGDGPRYRGRGLIQETGRDNYIQLNYILVSLGVGLPIPDFENEPDMLLSFPWALLSAIAYWYQHHLNRAADRDDVDLVTRLINGGTNGLAQRKILLGRAKTIWMNEITEPGSEAWPTIVAIQKTLCEAGFKVFVDGIFGDYTKLAVMDFQKAHGLDADGIVGPKTWMELQQYA